jgi:hypothetical protein
MKRTLARGFSCCLVVIAACSSSATIANEPGVGAADGGQPSPSNLRQFESAAEGMSEFASPAIHVSVDWAGCQGMYDQAVVMWQQLKPIVLAAGSDTTTTKSVADIDAALAAYSADVAQKDARAAETDANKITLAVPNLFDLFVYPAPTDTLRLDGTFRQLQIDAEYSDWAGCAKDLADTITVWNRLKPLAQAQAPNRPDVLGSATLIADVDATLLASQGLIAHDGGSPQDSTDLQAQAQKGLDLTDVAEQIFK